MTKLVNDKQVKCRCSVDIFITQSTRHGYSKEIGIQLIFCVLLGITDTARPKDSLAM